MSAEPGSRRRRAPLAGVAAVVALAVVWVPVILFVDDIVHRLSFDDAWYYFTIARNVADGAGSTFDGIHETNGYHPLWMLVCAVPYALGLDGTAAVRSLLLVGLAMWAGATWLLAGAMARLPAARGELPEAAARRRDVVAAVGWVALVANPFTVKLYVNGMESALVALCMAAVLAGTVRRGGDPIGRPVLGGLLLGAMFLARTDTVFLVAAAFGWAVLRERRITRDHVVAAAVTGAIAAAYLASNVALFGNPMQISGVTKRVALDGGGGVKVLACLGLAALVVVVARRAGRSDHHRLPRSAAWVAHTGWFAAGCLALLAYNWGLSSELFLWHYGAPVLWVLVLVSVALADLVEAAALEAPDPAAASKSATTIAAIVLAPLVAMVVLASRSFTGPDLPLVQSRARSTAAWANENLPPDSVIGSFDAGVLGYFSDLPVVNLDGLVNSFEWRDARHEGTAATAAMLERAGVTHLANQGDPRAGDDAGLRQAADALIGEGVGAGLELVHREDFTFTDGQPYTFYVFELPADA